MKQIEETSFFLFSLSEKYSHMNVACLALGNIFGDLPSPEQVKRGQGFVSQEQSREVKSRLLRQLIRIEARPNLKNFLLYGVISRI